MPDPVKAANYIQQLNEARCDDNWDAVPELIRKVRKHAPERTCLAQTAATEHSITKASVKQPSTAEATDAAASSLEAATHLPTLLTLIETETLHPEDLYQARVCVGWLHWVLREYSLALERLPRTFEAEYPDHADEAHNLSEWTKVCALKAAYLRANCLARQHERAGALEAFEVALPSLSSVWTAGPTRPQTRYWAELFLTEYCMLASTATKQGEKSLQQEDCLSGFRTWAKYWAGSKNTAAQSVVGGYGFRGSVPRRQVWSEYYQALSEILQRDLPYPTGNAAIVNGETSARAQLRAELKKVEIIYQGLLYSETKFPKADELRAEVERFVNTAMRNWAILNGRGWKEHDLGTGGRDALSRGTLEMLYGAATKTYHSTSILRHLFTVHLALAEFDLAFMSFDSWFELVKKGKARVEKTGHDEPALDSNATTLETISACIAALCRYGGREAVEKAYKLAEELEKLTEKYGRTDVDNHRSAVPLNILSLAWQSVGLANAQWARTTFDSESRSTIQEKAIKSLRRSLSPEFGNVVDVKGVFALGVLYAEQRKLPIAIELVKMALLADKAVKEHEELHNGPFWRERSLIPLWHLLALMLSARQEYVMAARACEGAIEQFKDPVVLFGTRSLNGGFRSEHLNEVVTEKTGGDGIVDEMDDYEKESILEIKMTQLAILELVEGPAVAVNASTELLTLFPRLFGDLEQKIELSKVVEPPKTTATARSLRDSVFGVRSERAMRHRQSVGNNEKTTSRPQTMQSVATTTLTQHTTHEDPNSSRRSVGSSDLKGRSRNSLRKRDRSGSRQRAMSVSGGGPPVPPLDAERFLGGSLEEHGLQQYFTSGTRSISASHASPPPSSSSQAIPLRHAASHGSALGGNKNAEALKKRIESFSPLLPYVHFPQEHSKRKRKSILVNVWLTIAGFYRRAGLLDDSQKAIAEAQLIVQSLEQSVSNDAPGSESLSVRVAGWGMDKSVEQILADVWAEKGKLSIARGRPYQARADFETALAHFPDHAVAIVGLSNILLDIYTEKLLPPPAVPGLDLGGASLTDSDTLLTDLLIRGDDDGLDDDDDAKYPGLPSVPLGLGPDRKKQARRPQPDEEEDDDEEEYEDEDGKKKGKNTLLGPELPPPYKATSLPINDRLSARDRAYGLLSGLTKLGSGWNDSEAWFALARAYEESGQGDKARAALWWCVELEDGRGVREWGVVVGGGGYVL
ncbi:hypothetical protein QBC38DRAFT_406003 [Podospora fimiseda]|uniref:Filamentation protein n=1 Tax=Podospora fimiseda TaxID=252190 RepID=A0AAN7BYM1_9PEZI|nr:hypothetical protein QBC38DRAFT_406003 [Podospora fimiseda]